uniref:Uncharacterized protein n=1 Tax=Arundo donax TaxID=35708 RepID=A0A0A9A1K6_ARUDO
MVCDMEAIASSSPLPHVIVLQRAQIKHNHPLMSRVWQNFDGVVTDNAS